MELMLYVLNLYIDIMSNFRHTEETAARKFSIFLPNFILAGPFLCLTLFRPLVTNSVFFYSRFSLCLQQKPDENRKSVYIAIKRIKPVMQDENIHHSMKY